jgi:SAM-dependent methyltransferase
MNLMVDKAAGSPMPMLLPEDAYGRAKRQLFVDAIIREHRPQTVLDFGCGTGSQLTAPLAAAHPGVQFLGVDSDDATLDWARRHAPPANLSFGRPEALEPDRRFDLVIASEVLEHVEQPGQLLDFLRGRLNDGGRLIVTVPNGHGPFETMSFIEHVFTLIGVLPLLRWVKHRLFGKPKIDSHEALTLAISPHLNFFSFGAMQRLLRDAGFEVIRYRPRTLFCGFIIEWAIRGPLIAWNARVADRLPAWCASDWMFECVKTPEASAARAAWRPTLWGRFRRYLSERRWAGVSLPHH